MRAAGDRVPHSSGPKARSPPPEISALSECVPRSKINPPSRRPVGPFGFPAAAMILNNAIAGASARLGTIPRCRPAAP